MTDDPAPFIAHDIPDLLNALPTMFGFGIEESLVAIATVGPRRRFGFRLRLDLPPSGNIDISARAIVHHLRAQGADGAIVIAVADDQALARDLTLAVEAHLGDIEPVVVARADDHRYWVDVPGFPADGIAYERSDHHVAIVRAIAAGQEILPDRAAVEARFAPVSGERREQMQIACAAALAPVLELMDGDPDDLARSALDRLAPVIRRIEARAALTDDDVAALCVWLACEKVRDAIWNRITPDTARAWAQGLAHTAGLVVEPYESSILALSSFASWACGDGVRAAIALERARRVESGNTIAEVMTQVLQLGLSPQRWRVDTPLRPAG